MCKTFKTIKVMYVDKTEFKRFYEQNNSYFFQIFAETYLNVESFKA